MQRRIRINRLALFFLLINISVACYPGNATAQMFGERALGSVGTLQGTERFYRGNRSRRDFVGADRSDVTGFVGAQQAIASGRVRSAVEGLRIDAVNPRRVNRPLTPVPTTGLYHPRLELDLLPAAEINPDLSQRVSTSSLLLSQRIERVAGPKVQVLMNDTTAILRGTVESQKAADLLEQILMFEPGIDQIVNELQVRKSF